MTLKIGGRGILQITFVLLFATVLSAQDRGLLPKYGLLPKEQWQKEAESFVEEELLSLGLIKRSDIRKQSPDKPALKKYFMHGVGHPLGLDVHDVFSLRTIPIAARGPGPSARFQARNGGRHLRLLQSACEIRRP